MFGFIFGFICIVYGIVGVVFHKSPILFVPSLILGGFAVGFDFTMTALRLRGIIK
jgi:hypothetical protein